MSIYVGNLSYDVTPDDLSAAFAEYGTVKRSMIPTDRETGRSRGFGFVEMSSEDEEQSRHKCPRMGRNGRVVL
ncbi:RNA-binding protein [Arthrospira platensis]|uniref:RNA recognition motif domain-containing protein n=1 Tax=Limnospira platensis TaxID=118562 RepID=UPI000AE7A680